MTRTRESDDAEDAYWDSPHPALTPEYDPRYDADLNPGRMP